MTEESIDSYLEQIFKDRHYCPTCQAMTPSMISNGRPIYFCDICDYSFDRELPVLSWLDVNRYHKHS